MCNSVSVWERNLNNSLSISGSFFCSYGGGMIGEQQWHDDHIFGHSSSSSRSLYVRDCAHYIFIISHAIIPTCMNLNWSRKAMTRHMTRHDDDRMPFWSIYSVMRVPYPRRPSIITWEVPCSTYSWIWLNSCCQLLPSSFQPALVSSTHFHCPPE